MQIKKEDKERYFVITFTTIICFFVMLFQVKCVTDIYIIIIGFGLTYFLVILLTNSQNNTFK